MNGTTPQCGRQILSNVIAMTESSKHPRSPFDHVTVAPPRAARAAVTFIVLVMAVMTGICVVFLISNVVLPDWFTIVGRWIPAVLSLAVIMLFQLPRSVGRWWMLRPGGMRRLLAGSATGLVGLVAIYAGAAAIAVWWGAAAPLSWTEYAQIAALTVPVALLFTLSTLGEEVGWRAFLPQLMPDMNRWVRAAAISGVWVVFHIPLHGTMILQGTLPAAVGAVSTILLLPLGVFLAMLVERFGSVWPAAIAHAVPMSVLNLVVNPADQSLASLWILALIASCLLIIAAVLVAPRRR